MALGNLILTSKGASAQLKQHEYGHKKQYDKLGNKYWLKIGLPSLYNAIENDIEKSLFGKVVFTTDHDSYWTETEANQLADNFFGIESQLGPKEGYPFEAQSTQVPWYDRAQIYLGASFFKYVYGVDMTLRKK